MEARGGGQGWFTWEPKFEMDQLRNWLRSSGLIKCLLQLAKRDMIKQACTWYNIHYMHVFVCMCVCVYVCMYVCMCVCVGTWNLL